MKFDGCAQMSFFIPEINEQNELLNNILAFKNKQNKLNTEIEYQKQLISHLTQAILQEAIQGKLTQEWRVQNPNTEPASELLKRIIVEKEKLFNAYLLINNGEMKVISKKFHLPNNSLFDEHRYFEQSHYKDLIEVKGIKIGFPICEDIWYSDISNTLKKRGANLLISPNGSPYEKHKLRKRHTEVFKRCKET